MTIRRSGKVRDLVKLSSRKLALFTTDRVSAFDVVLGEVPHKGQILTELCKFWFEVTQDIIPNHVLDVIMPNLMVVRECRPIPIEVVVRGYITGVTSTSIWGSYQRGERVIYGITFPDGLQKNQRLPLPVITPTTKSHAGHDQRLTREEIISLGLVDESTYQYMERAALDLFKRGTEICARRGLILVDTKYEFGEQDGEIMLIDEIHTPDSSRFWDAHNYKERLVRGWEPSSFDKEILRIWLTHQGFHGEGAPPRLSSGIIQELSRTYIAVYETILGKPFVPFCSTQDL